MAVNPWVIEYSRTSWVQSLLPFLVNAVAWLLWPVLLGQSRRPVRRAVLALLALTALTQTYLLAFLTIAPVSLLLLIFRRRVPARGVLIGAGIFAVMTTLYGVGLLSEWDQTQQDVAEFSSGEAHFSAEAWNHAVRLVTGDQYEVARRGHATDADFNPRHQMTRVASTLVLGALSIGIGAATMAIIRPIGRRKSSSDLPDALYRVPTNHNAPNCRHQGSRRDAAIIALIWFGLPILAMSYTSNRIHPTYQLLGLPAGYVLAAWGLGLIFRPDHWRWGRIALIVLWLPFAALMLTNSARHYQDIRAHPGQWGLEAQSVDYGLRTGQVIAAYLPENGVVYAAAPEWALNSFAGRLFPVIRDTRAPAFNYLPANGGLYITVGAEELPLPFGGIRVATLPLPDGKIITFDQFPPAAEVSLPEHTLNIASRQGITLASYDLSAEGDTWTLLTAWRVDFVAPEVYERIFAPFLHVVDEDGNQALNINGEGMDGFSWRPGDIHIHRITFTLPSDLKRPLSLRIGQYDGLHNANVIFVLPEGDNTVITLPEMLP